MKSVLGIIVLAVCAIGAVSVMRWAFVQGPKLLSKKLPSSSPNPAVLKKITSENRAREDGCEFVALRK